MLYDDLAQKLFGAKRAESNAVLTDATTGTIHGRAVTDSADGSVVVEITGDVTNPDPVEIDGEVYYDDAGTGIVMPTSENVKAGDEVLVSVYGEGTMRSPAVTSAIGSGDRIAQTAEEAETLAGEAWEVAEAVGQHVWTAEDGLHITEITQEEWETNPSGANQLMNSNGTLIRDGEINRTASTPSGYAIYDGQGNESENIVASFSANGTVLGRDGARRLMLSDGEMLGVDDAGAPYINVSQTGALDIVAITKYVVFSSGKQIPIRGRTLMLTTSVDVSSALTGSQILPGDFKVVFSPSGGGVAQNLLDVGSFDSCQAINRSEALFVISASRLSFIQGTPATVSASGAILSSYGESNSFTVEAQITYAPTEGTITIDIYADNPLGRYLYVRNDLNRSYQWPLNYEVVTYTPTYEFGDGDASGSYSAIIGRGTDASSDYQLAIGRYNEADSSDQYAFIIGNGTSDSARSNALTVEWDGDVTAGTYNGIDITALDSDVTDLGGDVSQLSTDLTALLTRVQELENKLPVELFKGTYAETYNKTITLSESTDNFSRICIEWRTSDGANGSTMLDMDVATVTDSSSGLTGRVAAAIAANNNPSATSVYIKSKLFFVSGNTIRNWSRSISSSNVYQRSEATVKNNAATVTTNNELIGITKVLGWR